MREELLKMAEKLQPELEKIRRDLHKHPGTGFDIPYSLETVERELKAMGYEPKRCGRAGITALVGGKKPGRCILLRGDMDALPLEEHADVEFKSETPGKMHACGHDMHTAMMLGAAKILKENEDQIQGVVKLAFQPAEEIFQGAKDMIENGLLENPKVDAAAMIHVAVGVPMEEGTVIMLPDGIAMSSCEQYHITVTGKGGHGSTPHVAIDPITAAAHIHIALQEINSRELDPYGYGVFTTCKFQAGQTSNVIPADAQMWGTIRTNDSTGKVGSQIKNRIEEITKCVATAFRCHAEVEFFDYCPCVMVDEKLSVDMIAYLEEIFPGKVLKMEQPGGGSEDFAFISHQVPSVDVNLVAGDSRKGYVQAVHHPMTKFDDSILWKGSAAYAYMALRWLEKK